MGRREQRKAELISRKIGSVEFIKRMTRLQILRYAKRVLLIQNYDSFSN